MKNNKIGLSREYIIHPGETLGEVLKDRKIKVTDLAFKTGCSETFINNIINGRDYISADFALRLDCVLNINSKFWLNLQNQYDKELAEFKDK